MASAEDQLIEDIQEIIGDSLRVVATYDEEEYEIHYVRSDLLEKIEQKEPERIHRELVLEGFSREYLEQLFGAGNLRCMTFSFTEALAIHFVGTDHTGLYVAVDPDTFNPFPELKDRCELFVE